MTSLATPAKCPRCRKDDQTQPVPALVAAQTTHGATSGTAYGIGFAGRQPIPVIAPYNSSHTSQTPLARTLAFPPPPQPRSGASAFAVAGLLISVFLAIVSTWSILTVMPFPKALGVLVIPAGLGVLALLCVLVLRGRGAEHRRWAEHSAQWQAAVPIWESLHYCYRDDLAYQPATGLHMSPETVAHFCYNTAAHQHNNARPVDR